jgi:hypothetical protein
MREYFCGWYLKCQNETKTMALIPAYHIVGGHKTCSVQLITDDGAWNFPYPGDAIRIGEAGVELGNNHFGRDGMTLELCGPGIRAQGRVSFGPFTEIGGDIMGPFRYVPFLECRHSVFSMRHTVNGTVTVNDEVYEFTDGVGYIEGDRGYSFPRNYVWAQCCIPDGSWMLSVADIQFCGFHFTGVIGIVCHEGKRYRIATYLGARAVSIHDGEVVVKQGRKTLTIRCLEKKGHPLAAPVAGDMTRIIRESAACRVWFRFEDGGKTVLEGESHRAAFEYEYPQ